jgi:hypothetical protein
MVTVQQILQEHYDGFASRHRLPGQMRQAAERMRDCRTAALGGHLIRCPRGHVERIAYNSCRHRSCPQCSLLERERWLQGWKSRLLDCPHYHTIFTTPQDLLPLWRFNKKAFADVLFESACGALLTLLADEKYLGGRVGLLAALHTWGQTLAGHVHLHVLVSAGGVTASGQWQLAKKSCLLPRKVLMIVFRGKLREALLRRLRRGELKLPRGMREAQVVGLLNQLGRSTWNVKILERYGHGAGVATYLARYLKGGPLSNKRLVESHDGVIRFRYRDNRQVGKDGRGERKVLTLEAEQFLLRLLEHVPPTGLQTVRGFGLYANSQRGALNNARALLDQQPLAQALPKVRWQELCERLGHGQSARCPVCGAGLQIEACWGRGRSPPPVGDVVLWERGAA